MGIINFSKANCRNCYKCVRSCPVKSIKVKNEQAEIVEELCIGCGTCLRVCPQNAKEVKSEIARVKEFLASGVKVAISVAPSFITAFNYSEVEFTGIMRELGFSYVEETAAGAKIVIDEYEKYFTKTDKENYITSSCPALNYLVQKYYPMLVKNLIPIKSPMLVHGGMMKEKYGKEIKLVFAGPCLAKKLEKSETNDIDAVITFEELDRWIDSEKVKTSEIKKGKFDNREESARFFPVSGAITENIKSIGSRYRHKVDGIEECIEFLETLKQRKIENTFTEINICRGSCINGPAFPETSKHAIIRKQNIENYIRRQKIENSDKLSAELVNPEMVYSPFYKGGKKADLLDIREILRKIGKESEKDELNCGACGYNSCQEKANAVYNGMAELDMCLPYMRHRAEMISNTIFENTPAFIFIINMEYEIIDLNPAAERAFYIEKEEAIGKKISLLMDEKELAEVIQEKNGRDSCKIKIEKYDLIVIRTILFLEKQSAYLLILHDITKEERKEEELRNLKIQAIDMTQEVITRQMMTAQEIASLLGETTAETKVTLTRLKKLIQGNGV